MITAQLKRLLPEPVLVLLRHLQPLHKLRRQIDGLNELMRIIAAGQHFDALPKDKVVEFEYNGETVKFYVPRGRYDFIQQHFLLYEDFCESNILHDLKQHYITKDSTVLDIGANAGNHTVYFAKIIKAKSVTCFEPQPFEFATLTRNIELNGLTNVKANNFALGEIDGMADFDHPSKNTDLHGNRGATGLNVSSSGSMKMKTLDSLGLVCDFIKIDVEGHTHEVLKGGIATIKKCRPLIFAEIFSSEFKPCHKLLKELGYKLLKDYGDHNYLFGP